MKILSGGPPSFRSTYSLFNSYSKLMDIRTGGPLFPQYIFHFQLFPKMDENTHRRPQYIFLIQFVFKNDETPHWRPRPPPIYIYIYIYIYIPYSILILNPWRSSLEPPPSPQYIFLIPVVIKINENTGGPLLPQYIFLIHVLYKIDENTRWMPDLLICTHIYIYIYIYICTCMNIQDLVYGVINILFD